MSHNPAYSTAKKGSLKIMARQGTLSAHQRMPGVRLAVPLVSLALHSSTLASLPWAAAARGGSSGSPGRLHVANTGLAKCTEVERDRTKQEPSHGLHLGWSNQGASISAGRTSVYLLEVNKKIWQRKRFEYGTHPWVGRQQQATTSEVPARLGQGMEQISIMELYSTQPGVLECSGVHWGP